MAAPPIRGVTVPVAGLAASSPASTQVGDLVVVITWERLGSAAASPLSVNAGAGFTEIRNHFHNDGSTDGALAAAYKVATQAGAQSYQGFTSSTGSPVAWTGLLVLEADSYDISSLPLSNSVTATGTGVPNPPAITGLDAGRDYLVAAIAAWHFGSAVSNTATGPTGGYALQWQVAGSANGDLALATLAVTGVTSVDPGTFGDNQTPNGTCSMTLGFPAALALTPTRGQVAHAVLETPLVATRGRITVAELETPLAPTRGLVAVASLETPIAPTRGRLATAALEVPNPPADPTRGLLAWAQFDVPALQPTRGRVAFAALELPLVSTQGRLAWSVLEVPLAPTRGRISFAELGIANETASQRARHWRGWHRHYTATG